MKTFSLHDFVAESNHIEGIKAVRDVEIEAHEDFLIQPITIDSLVRFVGLVANAQLRDRIGMDVWIGSHCPISGNPRVRLILQELLDDSLRSVFEIHREYETLHPFMDGNGRSGRVLWLHQMGGIDQAPLGFLHTYYYQSLAAESRTRASDKNLDAKR